jgi:hypothetical protein
MGAIEGGLMFVSVWRNHQHWGALIEREPPIACVFILAYLEHN